MVGCLERGFTYAAILPPFFFEGGWDNLAHCEQLQAGSIITLRIIVLLAAPIISRMGGYYTTRPCAQVDDMFAGSRKDVLRFYPGCAAYYSGDLNAEIMISANMYGNIAEVAVAAAMVFGPAGWLTLTMHAIGVEVYVSLSCLARRGKGQYKLTKAPCSYSDACRTRKTAQRLVSAADGSGHEPSREGGVDGGQARR